MGVAGSKDGSDGSEGSEGKEGGKDRMELDPVAPHVFVQSQVVELNCDMPQVVRQSHKPQIFTFN